MSTKLIYLLLVYGMILYATDQKITVPLNEVGERHIVVVVASYNNAQYYRKNIDSILNQQYSNYHVIYIDDSSTDNTYQLVQNHIKKHRNNAKVILLRNEKHKGALHNQYDAIHMCKDTDLIVIVDGDDALHDNEVLSFLNTIYSNSDIWLTYGQWVDWITRKKGWCIPMPLDIIQRNAFREFTHNPSHLRTFYAGLFKQIKKEDLIYQKDFFQMSGDVAAMFPMIEMARNNHFLFIDRPLLIYNSINPINDHKVVQGLQYKLDVEIRKRQRYEPIETPFLSQDGGIE